jgi:hypothetical protein
LEGIGGDWRRLLKLAQVQAFVAEPSAPPHHGSHRRRCGMRQSPADWPGRTLTSILVQWEGSGRPVGGQWEASGRPVGGQWEASGRPMCGRTKLICATSSWCCRSKVGSALELLLELEKGRRQRDGDRVAKAAATVVKLHRYFGLGDRIGDAVFR